MLAFDVVLGTSPTETYQAHVQVLTERQISLQVPRAHQVQWLPILSREFAIHGTRCEWIGDAYVITAEEEIRSLEQALDFIGRIIPSASVMLVG